MESGVFTALSICRERSFPNRFAKIPFGSGCGKNRRDACSPFSGVFENQDAAIIEGDFLGAPCRALIDAVWVGIGWIPGTVERGNSRCPALALDSCLLYFNMITVPAGGGVYTTSSTPVASLNSKNMYSPTPANVHTRLPAAPPPEVAPVTVKSLW